VKLQVKANTASFWISRAFGAFPVCSIYQVEELLQGESLMLEQLC
jgi:hypothetical protein